LLTDLPPFLKTEVILYLNKGLIESVPFMREMNEDCLSLLVIRLEPLMIAEGEFVYKQGFLGSAMYLVSQGTVARFNNGAYVDSLEVGEFFGESALFTELDKPAKRQYDFVAVSVLRLMSLTKNDFDDVLGLFPVVRAKMEQHLKRSRSIIGRFAGRNASVRILTIEQVANGLARAIRAFSKLLSKPRVYPSRLVRDPTAKPLFNLRGLLGASHASVRLANGESRSAIRNSSALIELADATSPSSATTALDAKNYYAGNSAQPYYGDVDDGNDEQQSQQDYGGGGGDGDDEDDDGGSRLATETRLGKLEQKLDAIASTLRLLVAASGGGVGGINNSGNYASPQQQQQQQQQQASSFVAAPSSMHSNAGMMTILESSNQQQHQQDVQQQQQQQLQDLTNHRRHRVQDEKVASPFVPPRFIDAGASNNNNFGNSRSSNSSSNNNNNNDGVDNDGDDDAAFSTLNIPEVLFDEDDWA
jgi:CRP-like cAMP-binding protein